MPDPPEWWEVTVPDPEEEALELLLSMPPVPVAAVAAGMCGGWPGLVRSISSSLSASGSAPSATRIIIVLETEVIDRGVK